MDRLDMAIALLQEAKEEKERLVDYEKENAKICYDDPDRYRKWEELHRKYPRTPKKSVINDNIKMARRIILGEYM